MSDALAGTPSPQKDDTPKGGTPEAAKDGSGNDAQKWQEALKWKQKAEDYNKVEAELEAERARVQELERIAYGGGARQATDPRAALVAQLQEQAQYDPVAQATLLNMRESLEAKAEVWLANQLMHVPDAKRDKVADIVRSKGYQVSASDALKFLEDPETKTMAAQLAEMKQELDRLKGAKPNGVSPSAATPSSVSADDGRELTEIKRSEYTALLRAAGPGARELMRAVGEGKTKLVEG